MHCLLKSIQISMHTTHKLGTVFMHYLLKCIQISIYTTYKAGTALYALTTNICQNIDINKILEYKQGSLSKAVVQKKKLIS